MRVVADLAKPPAAPTPLATLQRSVERGAPADAATRPGAGGRSFSRSPSPAQITLILADAGPMFRLGLRVLLRNHEEFEIEEAGDLDTLVALIPAVRPPAMALIDLDLPPAGGAVAVSSARDAGAVPVVWCSGSRLTPDVVYELVRAGAVGILRKEIAPSGIVRTLRAAANGEAALPRDLVAGLLARIRSLNAPAVSRPPIATLSNREREVLALVAEGDSNKAIARKLYISEFTAKRHVQNVLNKLSLHRRQDAATRFREESEVGLSASTIEMEQS